MGRRTGTGWIAGMALLVAAPPAWADADADFRPGYRIVRVFVEDDVHQGSVGVELGWAARWNDDVLITPSTGLHLTERHANARIVAAWTAALRVASTRPFTPFLEIGVNAGEGIAEMIGDVVVENRERDWVDTDAYTTAGFEFGTARHWRGSIYYRAHSRRADGREIERSEMLGVGVIYRFARVRLLWWQIPL